MKKISLFSLILLSLAFTRFIHADVLLEDSKHWWMVWSGQGAQGLLYSHYVDSWAQPQSLLKNSANLDYSPAIGVDSEGSPAVVFIRQDNQGLYFTRWDKNHFIEEERLDSASDVAYTSPSITIDDQGQVWIVAVGNIDKSDNIYVFRETPSSGWEKTRVSSIDLYPDIDPSILFTDQKVIVAWSGYDGTSYRMFFSQWNKGKWTEEARLDILSKKGGDEYPSLFLQDGQIYAAWQRLDQNLLSHWQRGSWSPSLKDRIKLMDVSYLDFLEGVHGAQASFGWFRDVASRGTIKAILLKGLQSFNQTHMNKIDTKMIAKFFQIKMREAFAAGIANKYTAFGDSITEGAGGGGTTYPRQLEIRLDNNIAPSEVVNRGLGGEQTTAGIERINDVLGQDNPEFILIMEGTNDVTAGRHRSVVGFNLEEMVIRSKNFGTNPILATIPSRNPGDSLQKGMPQYAETIRDVATKQGIPLCDVFAVLLARSDLESLFSDTRIHFTSTGYDVIAEAWFDTIASIKGITSTSSDGGGGCGMIQPRSPDHNSFNLEIPFFLLFILIVSKTFKKIRTF